MSPTASTVPDEFLEDSPERPQARGAAAHRQRGPAAGREVLSNPASARISRVAGLSRRNARAKHRRFLVEGPQGVREAVRHAPGRVLDVYFTEAALERHGEIWDEIVAAGLYVHVTTQQVMDAMSPDAQGLLAVVATEEVTGSEALTAALNGARLVAVLTQTQDPGNAGTIIRAADAAGADAVVLVRGSVDPTAPKVVRSTAGSSSTCPWSPAWPSTTPSPRSTVPDSPSSPPTDAGTSTSSRPSPSWRPPVPGCSVTRPTDCPQRR